MTLRRPARPRRAALRPTQERDNHGHRRTCSDSPPAHRGARRARGEGAQRPHAALEGDVRARPGPPLRRRRLVLPAARPVADLPGARHRARASGTSTATRCGTSTTASARWSRATRTRRSARRSTSATRPARTSRRRPRTRSSWVTSSPAAGALPKWRFTNSGSESTMDAIRIARGTTGRETIVKIFGSYHGHHDGVMVSIGVEYDQIGDHENLASLPYGAGIPQAVVDLTIPVPFNDAGAMERRIERLTEEGRKPACVIMEPAMMNLGVVLAGAGLPRGRPRHHPPPRHPADLRRGQDRPVHRRRRRDRALRRDAGPRDAGQGAGRRHADRRDRRHRGGDGRRRGRLRLPGRHLQREPARHGRDAREPARGPDARPPTSTSIA